jgi:hypothetical protein
VDRFSDAQEHTRPLIDRQNLAAARSKLPNEASGVGPAGRSRGQIAGREGPCGGLRPSLGT